MNPLEADDIGGLLARLMEGVRDNPTLTAEVRRAEREFFQANPKALREDPRGLHRFREWFLLERESDVLGGIPVDLLPMSEAERESLEDSLVGVFLVSGSNSGEYVVVDLQGEATHDITQVDNLPLNPGDLIIGRLFDGPLDVFMTSTAMACQRAAKDLAAAFTRDVRALSLDRRLTQSEIEHLLFRSRAKTQQPAEPAPPSVPLEHLEADLEKCLEEGGIDVEELSATAISASLSGLPRPGLVVDPLLEKIAFDSAVDLKRAQRIMLQIWEHRNAHPRPDPAPQAERSETKATEPSAPPPEDPGHPDEPAGKGLGASILARIEAGMEKGEDLENLFTNADEMVGEPDLENPDQEQTVEGNLRPLITEYLWEIGPARRGDTEVLEQFVTTQCEASLPCLDLEAVTITDLLRLLMQAYLASAPGRRTVAVGESFAVLERFFRWAQETQEFELEPVLAGVRESFVDHVVRLESAGLGLSQIAGVDGPARSLYRVVTVAQECLEIAAEDGDELLRIDVPDECRENLRPEDLLLTAVRPTVGGQGTLAGMVIAIPAIARDLLG